MNRLILLFMGVLWLCACPDSPQPVSFDGGVDAGSEIRPWGDDEDIVAFASEHIYFGGGENRRKVQVEVEFPGPEVTYNVITGYFRLHCPNRRCDHWDRYGSFGVVENPGTDSARYIEIDRFITPYRVGFEWQSDLTDLRPLLTGQQTLEVYIDTWVGPGHEQGEGWLFDAQFEFLGGDPPQPEPDQVIPVWPHLSYKSGRDDLPIADQVLPVSIPVDGDPQQIKLRSFITGHGFGGPANCAEFCPKEHRYTVNGDVYRRRVWRDDCERTRTDGRQMGTWQYDRAGWCPGAQVFPWDMDISRSWIGERAEVSYDLEPFTWSGEGGEPYYYMSGVVITYR